MADRQLTPKTPTDSKLLEAARKQNERDAKLAQMLGTGDSRGLKLVGSTVSKSTFYEAVKENMETFGYSKDKAVVEAKKEFDILGVDVSKLADEALTDAEL